MPEETTPEELLMITCQLGPFAFSLTHKTVAPTLAPPTKPRLALPSSINPLDAPSANAPAHIRRKQKFAHNAVGVGSAPVGSVRGADDAEERAHITAKLGLTHPWQGQTNHKMECIRACVVEVLPSIGPQARCTNLYKRSSSAGARSSHPF